MSWASVCEMAELREGEGRYAEIDGYQLAIFLHEKRVYVMDNACPHAGGSLAGGYVEDGCAVCPWHAWAFRLNTGELKGSPLCRVRVYEVRILERDGKSAMVQVKLPTPGR